MPSLFNKYLPMLNKIFATKSFNAPNETDTYHREKMLQLRGIMNSFVLRRLKADVLKELPVKKSDRISCEMTPNQRFVYDNLKVSLKEERDRCTAALIEFKNKMKERKDETGFVFAEGVKRNRVQTLDKRDYWVDDEIITRKVIRKNIDSGRGLYSVQDLETEPLCISKTKNMDSVCLIDLTNDNNDDKDKNGQVSLLKEVNSCDDYVVKSVEKASLNNIYADNNLSDNSLEIKENESNKFELKEIVRPTVPNSFMMKAIIEFRKAACHPLLLRTKFDDEKLKIMAMRVLKVLFYGFVKLIKNRNFNE